MALKLPLTENFGHTTIAKVIQFQGKYHLLIDSSPAEAAMDRGNVGIGVTGGLVEVAVVIIRHVVRPTDLSNVHLQ